MTALRAVLFPLRPKNIPGLMHAECMHSMTLGSEIFSASRILVRQLAVFAEWENEKAIDDFLSNNAFGRIVAKGWHVRLAFVRQWGNITELDIPKEQTTIDGQDNPVVAVTLARLKLTEVPRFIEWGRPVEKLVRDHPAVLMSTASIRLPNTVSTFSIWKSQKEMTDMVQGHSAVPHPRRHIDAMNERDRKDFHFEFTTLRFRPLAEFGEWNGRTNIIAYLSNPL